MTQYTLELFNGHGWLAGAEAQNFVDYDAAYSCAIYTIRDLVSSEIREGVEVNLAHFISICDDHGHEIQRIRFRDAVCVIDRDDRDVLPKTTI
jgi:hypothetical protein